MVRGQNPSECVVMLQPQLPPAYPPGQSVPQGPYAQGPHPGQPMVAVQPATFMPATPPSDYLCYSIFTMLCCCIPLGLVALVFSVSTRNAAGAGHRELAERHSKSARTLNHSALILGIIFIVLTVVFKVVIVPKLTDNKP